MSTRTNQELIVELYAAFNHRQVDTLLAFLSTEVDWPNGMEGGRLQGHDEVRAYWSRQWAAVDPHVEPLLVVEDAAGSTIVEVHQTVRNLAGEVLMDRLVRHVYSIHDGLIERMEILEPDAEPASQELPKP